MRKSFSMIVLLPLIVGCGGSNSSFQNMAQTASPMMLQAAPREAASGWENLGGTFKFAPRTVSLEPGSIDVFALDLNTKLKHLAITNGVPGPLEDMGLNALDAVPIAWQGAQPRIGHLSVFALPIERPHTLTMRHRIDGSAWDSWLDQGSGYDAIFSGCQSNDDQIDLLLLRSSGDLEHARFSGDRMVDRTRVPGPVSIKGRPALVSTKPGNVDAFVRGKDDSLWRLNYNGRFWSRKELIGTAPFGDPAVVATREGKFALFLRGPKDALLYKAWNGNKYSPSGTKWQNLGGGMNSDPVAVASSDGSSVSAIVRGYGLWRNTLKDGRWSWTSLGGGFEGMPSAVQTTPRRIDVFVRNGINSLWHGWWNNL